MSVVVLGQLAVLVEVAEPPEGFEGAVVVVGGIEAVELLQGLPAGFEGRGGRRTACRGVVSGGREPPLYRLFAFEVGVRSVRVRG